MPLFFLHYIIEDRLGLKSLRVTMAGKVFFGEVPPVTDDMELTWMK